MAKKCEDCRWSDSDLRPSQNVCVGNLVVLLHGELGRTLKIKVLEESQSSDFTSQNWRAADEELKKKNSLGSWPVPSYEGRSVVLGGFGKSVAL